MLNERKKKMEKHENGYRCGEILLETTIREYESEKNRTSVIDSKTNIVISLTTICFIAITETIDLNRLLSINSTSFATILLAAILFVSIVSSVIFAFLALIFFLRVIFTKEYKTIEDKRLSNNDETKFIMVVDGEKQKDTVKENTTKETKTSLWTKIKNLFKKDN